MRNRVIFLHIILLVASVAGSAHANTHIVTQPTQKPALLVVGDSLSSEYLLPAKTGWVHLLSKKLPSIEFVNASVSGATSADGLAIARYHFSKRSFSYVLIALGGNDFLGGTPISSTEKNLSEIARLAQGNGAQPVVLGINFLKNFTARHRDKIKKMFFNVGRKNKVPVVPNFLRAVTKDRRYLLADGLHFNQEAQSNIAHTVLVALQSTLALH